MIGVGVGIAIGIDFDSYVYSAALRQKRGEHEERSHFFDPDSDSDAEEKRGTWSGSYPAAFFYFLDPLLTEILSNVAVWCRDPSRLPAVTARPAYTVSGISIVTALPI